MSSMLIPALEFPSQRLDSIPLLVVLILLLLPLPATDRDIRRLLLSDYRYGYVHTNISSRSCFLIFFNLGV